MNCEIIQKQTPKVTLSLSWQALCRPASSEALTVSSTGSYSDNEKELESCYWGKNICQTCQWWPSSNCIVLFVAQLMSYTPLSGNCRSTNRFCSTEYLSYHVPLLRAGRRQWIKPLWVWRWVTVFGNLKMHSLVS